MRQMEAHGLTHTKLSIDQAVACFGGGGGRGSFNKTQKIDNLYRKHHCRNTNSLVRGTGLYFFSIRLFCASLSQRSFGYKDTLEGRGVYVF